MYTTTIANREMKHCSSCATTRPIYREVQDDQELTCCCTCSRILGRKAVTKEPE